MPCDRLVTCSVELSAVEQGTELFPPQSLCLTADNSQLPEADASNPALPRVKHHSSRVVNSKDISFSKGSSWKILKVLRKQLQTPKRKTGNLHSSVGSSARAPFIFHFYATTSPHASKRRLRPPIPPSLGTASQRPLLLVANTNRPCTMHLCETMKNLSWQLRIARKHTFGSETYLQISS